MAFDLGSFAAECHVADVPAFLDGCGRFYDLLIEANRSVNLTRITEPAAFRIKHIADSLAVARDFPEIAEEPLRIADLGCGAGFPSVVLARAFPRLRLTAIDSTGKKTAFVERAARELGVKNLRVVRGRGCELNRKPEFRRRFDLVTARAVGAAANVVLEVSEFAKRPSGRFLLYKTPAQAAEDLEALKIACRGWPIQWRVTPEFELPEGAGTRVFLVSRWNA